MKYKNTAIKTIGIALALLVSGVAFVSSASAAAPVLKWSRQLPGVTIRESSPMPINFDSGSTDIIFGARDSKVYVLNGDTGNSTPNWPQTTTHPIDSTPSSADVDGNGVLDIFIGSGVSDAGECSGGGLFRFRVDGSQAYKFKASDNAGSNPAQCADPAIHSSPAIGDINNNNSADINFGALGLKAWSLNQNGSVNSGWPYYWDDTQFATPALADVDENGVTDVVMGGDSSPGAPVDHRGGMVRALRGNGSQIWEFRINEMVRSSPVVGDVDGDGKPEVVFGAGNYWVNQPGGASDATKLYVLNAKTGQLKWSRDLGGQTLASPTLADFDGNGVRDIAIGTWDGSNPGQVWVIRGNNTVMSGYPRASGGGVVIGQISSADVNNDGTQDVIVPTGGGVFAYNGSTGASLWGLRQGVASYQNAPYVGDVDSNGRLDVVIAGTKPDGTGLIDRYEFATSGEASTGTLGWHMFHGDARLTGNTTPPPLQQNVYIPPGATGQGYVLTTSSGQVSAFGSAEHGGSVIGSLAQPIVGMSTLPNKNGYWLVAKDGGIFSFGDAAFYGSTGAIRLNQPIVGMASTPSGNGYWLVASDGGIFTFGDARFFGSTGNIKLNKPIVAMKSTPSGNGYWMVASDGGIFSFGDAAFHGSTGAIRLNQPIVGMAPTASGNGYWLVASDGGIFCFGDAPYQGSTGAIRLNQPITAMMRAPGNGYWLVASDGGIFTFGAPFYGAGSAGGTVVGGSVQATGY